MAKDAARKRRPNRSKAEIARERLEAEENRLAKAKQRKESLGDALRIAEAEIADREKRVEYLRMDPDLPKEPAAAGRPVKDAPQA